MSESSPEPRDAGDPHSAIQSSAEERNAELEQIETDLAEVLEGELQDLTPEARATLERITYSLTEMWQGPLPDPGTLAGYKDLGDEVLEEVLAGARENRQHRFHMDRSLANTARLSLVLTFLFSIACLCASVLLVANDHEVVGALFGVAGVAPIANALVRGGGDWTGKPSDSGESTDEE